MNSSDETQIAHISSQREVRNRLAQQIGDLYSFPISSYSANSWKETATYLNTRLHTQMLDLLESYPNSESSIKMALLAKGLWTQTKDHLPPPAASHVTDKFIQDEQKYKSAVGSVWWHFTDKGRSFDAQAYTVWMQAEMLECFDKRRGTEGPFTDEFQKLANMDFLVRQVVSKISEAQVADEHLRIWDESTANRLYEFFEESGAEAVIRRTTAGLRPLTREAKSTLLEYTQESAKVVKNRALVIEDVPIGNPKDNISVSVPRGLGTTDGRVITNFISNVTTGLRGEMNR